MSDIKHKESKKFFDKGGVNSIAKNSFQIASKEQIDALKRGAAIYPIIRDVTVLQAEGNTRETNENKFEIVKMAEKEIASNQILKTQMNQSQRA